MGVRMPETCWAVSKRRAINPRDWCIWLVWFVWMRVYSLYEHLTTEGHSAWHGSTCSLLTTHTHICHFSDNQRQQLIKLKSLFQRKSVSTNYGKLCANIMVKEILLFILVSYSTILLINIQGYVYSTCRLFGLQICTNGHTESSASLPSSESCWKQISAAWRSQGEGAAATGIEMETRLKVSKMTCTKR